MDKPGFALHLLPKLIYLLPGNLGVLTHVLWLQGSLGIFLSQNSLNPRKDTEESGLRLDWLHDFHAHLAKGWGRNHRTSQPVQITGQCCPVKGRDSGNWGRKKLHIGKSFLRLSNLSSSKIKSYLRKSYRQAETVKKAPKYVERSMWNAWESTQTGKHWYVCLGLKVLRVIWKQCNQTLSYVTNILLNVYTKWRKKIGFTGLLTKLIGRWWIARIP